MLFRNIFLFVATLGLAGALYAGISTDYVTYKAPLPGKTYLNYHFSLDNADITYKRDNEGFDGAIEATLYLYNEKEELQARQNLTQSFHCLRFDKTIASDITHYLCLRLSVNPGDYRARFVIRDKHSNKEFTKKESLHVPSYYGGFHLSAIQLFSAPARPGGRAYPNLERTYFFSAPVAHIYYESYFPESTDNVEVTYTLMKEDGGIVYTKKERVAVATRNPGFKTTLSTTSLAPGAYRLRISQNNGGAIAETENSFTVVQSPIDLRFKTYEQALREIRYLLTAAQYDSMRAITANHWQQALNEFWKKRDPRGQTPLNDVMLEYYRRMQNANKWFGSSYKKGWLTDLGMVYILLGQPDVVVKAVSSDRFAGGRQIWEYRKLHLRFTFISQSVFSEYSLINKNDLLLAARD